jgi:guanine nucleotide-binding protein G(i) subunit alpha
MGCIMNTQKTAEQMRQSAMDRKIAKEQTASMHRQEEMIKLLLLGAGESGKSTIFKQMKILYGHSWDNDELVSLKPVVFANIVQNMRNVLDYVDVNGIDLGDDSASAKAFATLPDDADITGDNGKILKKLWLNPGVKEAWDKRSGFQVLDCLQYYADEIDRISAPGYIPTQQDVLQSRVRTSGIVEEKYIIDGVPFVMFDVGGQRNERKKWIHAFDNVTAVIFVAAISEYDQVLYEDSQTNRIDEAIKLFDEIVNSSWFSKTSMILFLNKNDLFRAKLKSVPFRVPGLRYDDFAGPYAQDPGADFESCVEAAHAYITKLFVSRKRDAAREIYSHVTEATDTRAVHVVFNACKDIILRRNLVSSGFMD